MPKLTSDRFGELEYNADEEIHFPSGLPSFETEQRFVAMELPDLAPVVFLQSLSRPDLVFVTLPVLAVEPEYTLSMAPEDIEALALPPDRQPLIGSEILCLAIVTIGDKQPPTANLMAPVVVSLENRRALQAIQPDCPWSHQHLLHQE